MSEITRGEGLPAAEATEDVIPVRAMYQALEERDLPTLARHTDPSIEWVHPMVVRLPFDGTRHGLTAVLWSAFSRNADGTGPRVSAETFVELGDGVLVVGRLITDLEAGGERRERTFLHECFVRGERVVRIREYPV